MYLNKCVFVMILRLGTSVFSESTITSFLISEIRKL